MTSKRLLDLGLIAVATPFALPLVVILAGLTWLFDGRPIFFGQERVGQRRRVFRIWKLRTMTMDQNVSERRPTRWGWWMRDRGLDELPQLFNILRGEMSWVGPRPLTPGDAVRLSGLHAPFAARFEVTPGMTGLAQVCQAKGAALTARVEAEYVRRQSVAEDLSILLRTVWIHLRGKRRGSRPLPPEVL